MRALQSFTQEALLSCVEEGEVISAKVIKESVVKEMPI